MARPRWFALMLLAILPGSAVMGQGAPSESLARFVPKEGMFLFVEMDGTAAHSAAWQQTSAYKMLNDTPLGSMLRSIAEQAMAPAMASLPPGQAKFNNADVVAIYEHVLKHGFALAALGDSRDNPLVVFVVRNVGADKESQSKFARVLTSAGQPQLTKLKDGRQAVLLPGAIFWVDGKDLVLLTAPRDVATYADTVCDAAAGRTPNAASHPIRQELRAVKDGFQPVMVGFVDVKALPPLPPEAVKLGLDGLQRLDMRWGFQDKALYTSYRIVAPGPRKGVLALLDKQPTFNKDGMLPMPPDQKSFTQMSLNVGDFLDGLGKVMEAANPGQPNPITTALANFEAARGLKLREDVLDKIGPRIAFFVAGSDAPAATTESTPANPANPLASLLPMLLNPPKVTLIAELKDAKSFAPKLDGLIAMVNEGLETASSRASAGASGGGGISVKSLVGRPAPDFTLTVLESGGKTKTVRKADLAGKVVMMAFWSNGSRPSVTDLAEVQKMIRTYERGKKDFVFVAVNQDRADSGQNVRALIDSTLRTERLSLVGGKVSMVAMDPENTIGDQFQVNVYPTVLVIDKKGTVRSVQLESGAEVRRTLSDAIDRLLADRALANERGSSRTPAATTLGFKPNPGAAQPTYILNIPVGTLPVPLPPTVAPAIVLGKSHLAFGLNAKIARDALTLAEAEKPERWTPTGEFAAIAAKLPEKMLLLDVSDPSSTAPEVYANLPTIANSAIAAAMGQVRGNPAGNPAGGPGRPGSGSPFAGGMPAPPGMPATPGVGSAAMLGPNGPMGGGPGRRPGVRRRTRRRVRRRRRELGPAGDRHAGWRDGDAASDHRRRRLQRRLGAPGKFRGFRVATALGVQFRFRWLRRAKSPGRRGRLQPEHPPGSTAHGRTTPTALLPGDPDRRAQRQRLGSHLARGVPGPHPLAPDDVDHLGPDAPGDPIRPGRGRERVERERPQGDWPRAAQLSRIRQDLSPTGDRRPERQAAPELAGRDPALHRRAGSLQPVPPERALGQRT